MTNGQILQLKIWVFNFKVQTYKEVKSEGRILEGSQVACFRFCNLMLKRRRFEYFGFSIRFGFQGRKPKPKPNSSDSIRFFFSVFFGFFVGPNKKKLGRIQIVQPCKIQVFNRGQKVRNKV